MRFHYRIRTAEICSVMTISGRAVTTQVFSFNERDIRKLDATTTIVGINEKKWICGWPQLRHDNAGDSSLCQNAAWRRLVAGSGSSNSSLLNLSPKRRSWLVVSRDPQVLWTQLESCKIGERERERALIEMAGQPSVRRTAIIIPASTRVYL